MPTPVGHALAGLAVAGCVANPSQRHRIAPVAVLALCAVAPDFDLVLRLFDGVNHHRGPSHSLSAALVAGLCAAALRLRRADLPSGWAIAAAWGSHVLMDYLGVDTSPPAGEMALWPFSKAFLISPISVFYDVPRSFSEAAIRHNAMAVVIEVAVMLPIAALCWRRSFFGKSRSS